MQNYYLKYLRASARQVSLRFSLRSNYATLLSPEGATGAICS